MRADRLLSIMLLLQVHRQLTSRELARRLEVSQRTIHRDMEALSSAGVPVYAVRGADGGWLLDEGFRTSPVGLKPDEIRALMMVRSEKLMEDLGLGEAGKSAFIKVLGVLPRETREGADDIRQRFYLDAVGWRRPVEATPCLAELQDAIWSERQVRLTYRREEGEPFELLVEPLGLVASGPIWYLVATFKAELRTYRVSRIDQVTMLDEPIFRDPDFDLAAYWHASKDRFVANLPVYEVTLRLDSELLPSLQRFRRQASDVRQQEPADADGKVTVVMRFDVFEEAREVVLGWGAQVEVLAPAELRDWVADTARRVVQVYE